MSGFFKPIIFFAERGGWSDFQEYSIDLDGTEYMNNAAAALLGIENSWTISQWFKPNAAVHTVQNHLFDFRESSGSENRILATVRGDLGTNIFRILVYSSGGALIRNTTWNQLLTGFLGTWVHLTYVWDGVAKTLTLYRNGSPVIPTSSTDIDAAQTDTARKVWMGCSVNGTDPTTGIYHSFGVWDVALSSDEVSILYNDGNGKVVNWAENTGAYVSSANLQHWWRMGHEVSPGLGADSGYAATLIDIGTGAVGVTDADRVADAPPDCTVFNFVDNDGTMILSITCESHSSATFGGDWIAGNGLHVQGPTGQVASVTVIHSQDGA
jgi:hypothetical protein